MLSLSGSGNKLAILSSLFENIYLDMLRNVLQILPHGKVSRETPMKWVHHPKAGYEIWLFRRGSVLVIIHLRREEK